MKKDLKYDEKIGFYPNDWVLAKMGDLANFVGGGTPSTIEPKYWNGNIIWLVPSDLTALNKSALYIKDSESKITKDGLRASSAILVPAGTVCLSSRATIGEAVIAATELCTNQGFINIISNERALNIYLLYWVKYFKDYISRYAAGTTFLEIGKRAFKKLHVALPPLPEQKTIAAILSKVDEAIAAVEDSIKAAEKVKKALMQNLLTGKLKPDGTWRSEDEFYTDEKFGKIPKGWEIKKVSQLFTVNQLTLPSNTDPEFEFSYITIENVSTENIDFNNSPKYKFKEAPGRARRIINNNDILISGVRPNLKSFAIYNNPNNENWICSTGFAVLTPNNNQDVNYFFYQILGFMGERQFYSYVAGSNYPAISDRDVKNIKLLNPPYEIQVEIAEKFLSLSTIIKAKQTKIETLKKLKKSLMQNLLTGKIRINPSQFPQEISHFS